MRTIVHIGQHKTGTTSLQHYLTSNRKHLLQQGLYVPIGLAGFDAPSHFILNVYALNKERMSPMKELFKTYSEKRMADLFDRLQQDIHTHYSEAQRLKCDSVIWTNEGLYLLNSIVEYKTLFNLFADHSSSVECVCCFRSVPSYRQSYQQQLTDLGITPSLNPDSYRYTKKDSWLFDYTQKTHLLDAVFDDVLTFNYDPHDNVVAFLKLTGYDEHDASGLARLNTTTKSEIKPTW